jgi:hypothetical protein
MAYTILLMHYFPLIIVGLGQVLIAGMSPARCALREAARANAWGNVHAQFGEYRPVHRDVADKRAPVHLPQLPGRPVASLPRL